VKDSPTPTHKSRSRDRHHATLITLLVTVVFGATACGADHRTASDDRAIAIYSTVIRVIAPPNGRTPPTTPLGDPVFVVAANTHSPISLEVQAGIVEVLHNFATIRFVDERSEAIATSDPDEPVHERGVLITLGKIPAGRTNVTIDVQRYERIDDATTYRITLERVGTSWKPVAPPVPS
jgi:hypothetical protein